MGFGISIAGDLKSKLETLLELERSAQSGEKTLTGAYAVMYEDSDAAAWIFAGAWVDLTNMAVGDVVWFRISTQGTELGAFIIEDEQSFVGVQPADDKILRIGPFSNMYGVRIEAMQSAGAPPFLDLDMEFFTAKR